MTADTTIDTRALRDCLGSFATGVTVIACQDQAGALQGVTANSFSSVSLTPPLILWSIDQGSDTLQAFLNAEHFSVSVLSAAQQDLSNRFAQSESNLFDGVPLAPSKTSAPVLANTLASLECRTHQIVAAGDHHIIIGEVLHFNSAAGAPLLFHRGGYAELAS
ncbi:MAG: flavin reductase family protein [Pseudomonadales bacterium]